MNDGARERATQVARIITERNETDVTRYLARLLWHATVHAYSPGEHPCERCAEASEVGAALRPALDSIGPD